MKFLDVEIPEKEVYTTNITINTIVSLKFSCYKSNVISFSNISITKFVEVIISNIGAMDFSYKGKDKRLFEQVKSDDISNLENQVLLKSQEYKDRHLKYLNHVRLAIKHQEIALKTNKSPKLLSDYNKKLNELAKLEDPQILIDLEHMIMQSIFI